MPRSTRAVALAVAIAAALPATASAAEPSVERVSRHLDKAQTTVERAARLVKLEVDRSGEKARSTGKRARKEILLAQRRSQNAARGARKLAREADGATERAEAAWALTMAAAQQAGNVALFADLLNESDSATGNRLAGALPDGVAGFDLALELLQKLGAGLEGDERATVEQAVAWLTTMLPVQIDQLATAGTIEDLSSKVEDLVEDALGQATSTLEVVLGRLEGVTAMLPEPARAPMAMALGIVREQLGTVTGMVDQISSQVGGQLGGVLGTVDGLLGGLPLPADLPTGLPVGGGDGKDDGDAPAVTDPVGLLDGLLGEVPVGGDLVDGILGDEGVLGGVLGGGDGGGLLGGLFG